MYLQDYGTLSCWASNEVGTQQHPCLFQVVLAGKYPWGENALQSSVQSLWLFGIAEGEKLFSELAPKKKTIFML